MKLPTVSFSDKITPDYKPSALLPSYRNKSTDNNNYSSRMAVMLKGDPGQGANTLAQEMRNPLGHINLSVEMLESLIENNDLKMYLDIIKRNAIRIDNLLHEFLLESNPVDGKQTENISIH
jgi:signal transduction histidine kinase